MIDFSKVLSWLEPFKEVMNHVLMIASVCLLTALTVLLIPADWAFFKELIELRSEYRGFILLVALMSMFIILFKMLEVGSPIITGQISLMRKIQYIKNMDPRGKAILKRYFSSQQRMIDVGESNMIIDEMSRRGVIHFVSPLIMTLGGYNPNHYTIDDAVCDYLKQHMHLLENQPQNEQCKLMQIKQWLRQLRTS